MSRQTAAGTVFGGRITSEAAIAAPASTRSPTAIRCPTCPVSASTCPGSGLAAADLTSARPSGNRIVLSTRAPGHSSATGPTIATHAATAE